MRLSRALFVLPTLFTLTSVFLGLVSVISAAQGGFRLSALSILFAIVFDSIDGRVARLTRTQSKFGIQIDSLADVVSFGVAPAALVYLALLKERLVMGPVDLGLLAAFVYLAAGAVRLARYNVDAGRKPGRVKSFFTGLPIPAGAGCLAGMILGLVREGRDLTAGAAALMMFLMGLLMVSTVKYRKRLTLREPDSAVLLGILGISLTVVALVRPAFLLFTLFATYIAAGLVETSLKRLFRIARRGRFSRRGPVDDPADRNLP